MKKIFLVIFVLVSIHSLSAQVKDYELGSAGLWRQTQGGYFDYSDPEQLNINVSLWGFVKYPGRYLIPINSTVIDLLSYGGGPSDDALLEDLRLFRIFPDSSQIMIKFGLNELLHESILKSRRASIPDIEAGDVLLVPGEPRIYFREGYSMVLSTISLLISLTILVINLVN